MSDSLANMFSAIVNANHKFKETVDIPASARFQETVERIRRDPTIGRRYPRASYLEDAASRDATWRTTPIKRAGSDLIGDLTELYRASDETNP